MRLNNKYLPKFYAKKIKNVVVVDAESKIEDFGIVNRLKAPILICISKQNRPMLYNNYFAINNSFINFAHAAAVGGIIALYIQIANFLRAMPRASLELLQKS